MTSPSISVVIPVFNGAPYLPQAIESVRAQAYPHLELLVVDDGSSDASASIATALGATVVRHPDNLGVAAARNSGVRAATGDLIAFLDADDWWLPDKLAVQVDVLRRWPHLQGVTGGVECVRQDEGTRTFVGDLADVSVVPLLCWRSLFEQVGPFDESLRIGEDADWLLRARDQGARLVKLDRPLVRYRLHLASTTHAHPELLRLSNFEVIRRRRRRFGGAPPPVSLIPTLEES